MIQFKIGIGVSKDPFLFGMLCVLIGVAIISCSEGHKKLPDKISYNYHIRPILSDKCYACHGPDENKLKAGLRLDLADIALGELPESPGLFAIIPGNPDESELIRRVKSSDPEYHMPPPESHLAVLNSYEVALLEKWIKQGAQFEKHWAFLKPEKSPIPDRRNSKWLRNEIDWFILAEMKSAGLTPNPEADSEHLLKRMYLDLTGLLPTVEEMDRFEADRSEKAYEEELDRLLALPQYGEKMALYWLDIARYSDSYGYQDDNIRTQWPYRDWLIHAFNKNMPFDEFIKWQLAGDLIDPSDEEKVLATAFLRNHKYTEEGGVIPEEYRVEYIVDKVKTFGKGFLGLTLECAQCHDHKYDPISQKEYYQLFGFFNNSKEQGFEGDVSVSKPAKTPMLRLSEEERNSVLSFINSRDTGTLLVSVMEELDSSRTNYLLKRGAYDMRDEILGSSAPSAVMHFDTLTFPPNRRGLAEWTVSRDNPLTARCIVNQMWQEFFGRGLVSTPGDFGMQGSLPSHPELLDWLAVDFMENGWNVKRLVKQFLMSSTYRQSAVTNKMHLRIDPQNIYLARAPRVRMKAEFIRDMILSSSGLLVREIGGPSVKPYQPEGLWEVASSGRGELRRYQQDKGDDLYRRGMYSFIKLTLPPPAMMIFDASNRDQCEVKRSKTNTPLQALIMLNDPTVLEASRVLSQRLLHLGLDKKELIERAFRTILCRKPSGNELNELLNYYEGDIDRFSRDPLAAKQLLAVGEYELDNTLEVGPLAATMNVISTLYNLEEAITRS